MFKRICILYDNSNSARYALKRGVELAKEQKAKLRIVHYINYITLSVGVEGIDAKSLHDKLMKEAQNLLKKAQKSAAQKNVKAEVALIEGNKITSSFETKILKEIKRWRADLIVMGTHGRSGVKRLIFGSSAEHIIRKSHVSMLIFRSKK
jgi:nucleotide-binding universal stress UspA family protein